MSQISEQELLAVIMDTIPGYVSWISRDLKYLGINKAIADSYGLDRQQIVGQPLGMINGSDRDNFYKKAKDFFNSNKEHASFEICMPVQGKDYWQLVEAKK